MKINKSLLFATLLAAFSQTIPGLNFNYTEAAAAKKETKPSLYRQIEANEARILAEQGLSPLVQVIVEAQDYTERAELLLTRALSLPSEKSLTPAEAKLFKDAQDYLHSAIVNFTTLYYSLKNK